MTRFAAAAVLAAWLWGAPPAAADEGPAELIEKLGHPAYAQRRQAQQSLAQMGLAAFDAIRRAADDPDPEVAETSRRLLQDLTADWTRDSDPPRVRYWLSTYGEKGSPDRLTMLRSLNPNRGSRFSEWARPQRHTLIDRLSYAVGGMAGVEGLVRIARFEPSDALAAEAVATLLAWDDLRRDPVLAETLRDAVNQAHSRYGPGQRTSAEWLRLAVGEPTRATAAAWRSHALREAARRDQQQSDLSPQVIETLHCEALRASLLAADDDAALSAADALASRSDEGQFQRLALAIRWAGAAERWDLIDRLAEKNADLLTGKLGLYLLADAAALRGDRSRAEELAAKALGAENSTGETSSAVALLGPRIVVAEQLDEWRRPEWAIAEYDAASGAVEPLDGATVVARWRAHSLLLDAGRYAEAAARLRPVLEHIEGSKSALQAYRELPHVNKQAPAPQLLESRTLYAEALAARDRGDKPAQVEALKRAIHADPSDADILIAMHRVVDPPEDFAKSTRRRIAALARNFESEVWEHAGDNAAFDESNPYNQWAWLIGNTEGDFDKAVRYSQRSLQINPDEGGYLDTLGRCLFSAGRIEEAVQTQRRAIQLEPNSLVMRRQLAEFEAALAASGNRPAE